MAEETPKFECRWEGRGLLWMNMLTDGLNLRTKVFGVEVTMHYVCFLLLGSSWVEHNYHVYAR